MHTYILGGYSAFFGVGAMLLTIALVLQIVAQGAVKEVGGSQVTDVDGNSVTDVEKKENLQSWASFTATASLISFVLSVPGTVMKEMKA